MGKSYKRLIGLIGVVILFQASLVHAKGEPETIIPDKPNPGGKAADCPAPSERAKGTAPLSDVPMQVFRDLSHTATHEAEKLKVDDGRVIRMSDSELVKMINDASRHGQKTVEIGAWGAPLCTTVDCVFVDSRVQGLEKTKARLISKKVGGLSPTQIREKLADPTFLREFGLREENFIEANADNMREHIRTNSVKKLVMKGFLTSDTEDDEKWRVDHGFADKHLKDYYKEFDRVLSRNGGEIYILTDRSDGESESDDTVRKSYRHDIDHIIRQLNATRQSDLKVSHIRTGNMIGIVLRHELHESVTPRVDSRKIKSGPLRPSQSAPSMIRLKPKSPDTMEPISEQPISE